MAKIAFRAVRTRKRFFDIAEKKITEGLSSTIDKIVKPHFIKEHNKIVANWKHKPRFSAIKSVTRDGIELYVEATGPNAKYWIWTNEGTRPHLITPKRAPVLRFQTKYTPKTKPGKPPTFGGPGKKSGPWRSAKSVRHPGTKPRDFSGDIRKENARWFSNTMEQAWKRIIRSL